MSARWAPLNTPAISSDPKDMSQGGRYNVLYVIYRGTVSHNENDFPATNVYFPVRFQDILPSGSEFTYEEEPEIEGSTNLSNSGWGYYTSGYGKSSYGLRSSGNSQRGRIYQPGGRRV